MADLRAENGHPDPWKIDYFGVGNENWGCGGNMTPQFYANEYRRYQTYVRNYGKKKKKAHSIQKICCGANVNDYYWTKGVLKTAFDHCPKGTHGFMDGLSLHYYVHPEGWKKKGSATDFDDKVWYKTMWKALYIETLIQRHGAIMDQYDPKKKIGMIIDEWGSWYTVEPGTNPGFLYQQNTMRDALIAGVSLNIFNKHCDRVKMANIAQVVNVLQAVILTEGEKMLLTPTYHVFHMYKCHQDAELVESSIHTEEIGLEKKFMVPNLNESASIGKDGKLHITLNNLSITEDYPIEAEIVDFDTIKVSAQILTNEMHAMNTFDAPETVKPADFDKIEVKNGKLIFTIPACSVMSITIG